MRLLIATFAFGQLAAASTTLWNGLQSVFISANITTACDAAFNTSLNCPETVLQYLPSSVQAVGWNTTTLTSMCTSECEASLGDLADAVVTACGNDLRLPIGGQNISYEEIVDLIQYKFGLVCLADESTGEFCSDVEAGWNITEMVLLEEATWPTYTNKCYYSADGGNWLPFIDYDDSCINPFDHSMIYTSVDNLVSLGGAKTAVEYYKELPDPIDDDNYGWSEPLDFDEYPLEIQCSSCFLSRFEYGLTNKWGDAWDEITEQVWANMKLNCDLDKTISPAINLTGNGITNGSFYYEITPISTSCPQNLTIGATRMTCQEVAVSFGVPLNGILGLNNAISCAGVQNQDLCSPLSCPIGVVDSSVIPVMYDNLVDVAVYVKQFTNITMTQFKTWNPYLFSNALRNGDAVCVGPEGGAYVPPTATAAVPSVYTTTATPSNPTPSGTIDNCGLYYTIQSGDYCDLLCIQFSLTFSEFININPSIDSACSNLLLGYDYCVAPVNGTTVPPVTTTMSPSGSSSSSTGIMATSQTSTSSTATYATPPAATVSGTTAECEQWYVVQSGDTCSTIDAQYGITLEEFRAWNTYIDNACDNIWPDYAYCVNGPALSATSTTAAATSTTTTSTGVPTPIPTQAGMVSGCTEFYEAQIEDGCYDIATSYGVTLDEFIDWNPAVNSDCSVNAGLYWYDKKWPSTAKSRSYTIILVTPGSNAYNVDLGSHARTFTGPVSISIVVGGLNLFGNPNYSSKNNVICMLSIGTRTDPVRRVEQPGYISTCSVTYASTSVLNKRDGESDPGDESNFEIVSARLEDDWEASAVYTHNGMPVINEAGRFQPPDAATPPTTK